MRAVNLLPRDDRRSRTRQNDPVMIGGVSAVVAVTALVAALFLVASTGVADKQMHEPLHYLERQGRALEHQGQEGVRVQSHTGDQGVDDVRAKRRELARWLLGAHDLPVEQDGQNHGRESPDHAWLPHSLPLPRVAFRLGRNEPGVLMWINEAEH